MHLATIAIDHLYSFKYMNNKPIGICRESSQLNNVLGRSRDFFSLSQLEYMISYWRIDVKMNILTQRQLEHLILYYQLEFLANDNLSQ